MATFMTDRRVVRGEIRRYAWAITLNAIKRELAEHPLVEMVPKLEKTSDYKLLLETMHRIIAWLESRTKRGALKSPPGGVEWARRQHERP